MNLERAQQANRGVRDALGDPGQRALLRDGDVGQAVEATIDLLECAAAAEGLRYVRGMRARSRSRASPARRRRASVLVLEAD
jgi:hypothetical protein